MGKKSNFKYGKLYWCYFVVALYCTHWQNIGTVCTNLLISFQWRFGSSLIYFSITHTNNLKECAAAIFILEVTLKMEAAHSSDVSGIVCWSTVTFMFTAVRTSNLRFKWIFVLEICSKCCAHLITVCICLLLVQTHMKCKCNLKHFLYI